MNSLTFGGLPGGQHGLSSRIFHQHFFVFAGSRTRAKIEDVVEHTGERYAVLCLNRRISWYATGVGHIRALKQSIRLARTAQQIRAAIEDFLEQQERLDADETWGRVELGNLGRPRTDAKNQLIKIR